MVHLSNLGVERVRVAVSDSKQAKNKKRECLLAHLANLGVERVQVVVSDFKQAKNKQDCLLAHLSKQLKINKNLPGIPLTPLACP